VQRYFCTDCQKVFQSKRRKKKRVDGEMWEQYSFQKQSVLSLSLIHNLSERQIRRRLQDFKPSLKYDEPDEEKQEHVALAIDTTYFETFGVMVFRCATRKKNLLWYFVEHETNDKYMNGIEELKILGYTIDGVVCDGKTYLPQTLAKKYPVQYCQFHAMKQVRKYITKYPKTEAGRELKYITLSLTKTNKEQFTQELKQWLFTWQHFLQEKTFDLKTEREHFTHDRLRKACAFLFKNIPFLFTYQTHPETKLPNTTNTLDGSFSHLKQKIHVHRGLNQTTQKKMIQTLLLNKKFIIKKSNKKPPIATINVH
jgi:hypothetical protein